MKNVASVEVLLAGARVRELVSVPRRGTFLPMTSNGWRPVSTFQPLTVEHGI